MSQITLGDARSRQTAYLATEHWWKTRVEALRQEYEAAAVSEVDHRFAGWEAAERQLRKVVADLDALIAERNPR